MNKKVLGIVAGSVASIGGSLIVLNAINSNKEKKKKRLYVVELDNIITSMCRKSIIISDISNLLLVSAEIDEIKDIIHNLAEAYGKTDAEICSSIVKRFNKLNEIEKPKQQEQSKKSNK